MPPRLNLFTARAVPVLRQSANSSAASRRSFATILNTNRPCAASIGHGLKSGLSASVRTQRRCSSSGSDGQDRPKGPTEDPLPHVSEEAAEVSKIMDKKCDGTPASPELEQGTPISEILQRDKEALKHMPKVMQDQMKRPSGSRSFSTSARRLQPELQGKEFDDASASVVANMISQVNQQATELHPGLKFEVPENLPKTENFRKRYETIVEQFTKLLMQDGKLSKAQNTMAFILDHLRTAPPPNINPRRRLLPGPPAPQLPLNPVLYLTLIVDSVAPLLKLRQQKGILGGGVSVQVPSPLALRQRRRTAIKWIIDASDKRKDSLFGQRVANELVAVAEGRSGVWEKREQVHKLGVAGRSNLGLVARRSASRGWDPLQFWPILVPGKQLISLAARPENVERRPFNTLAQIRWTVSGRCLCCPALPCLFSFLSNTVSSNAGDRTWARIASARGASPDDNDVTPSGQSIELGQYPDTPATTARQSHATLPPTQLTDPGSDFPPYHRTDHREGHPQKSTPRDKPVIIKYWIEALRRHPHRHQTSGSADKMKFSHSIQFNAVPDWSAYYLAYSNLKKLIYSLEQEVHRSAGHDHVDVEQAPLLDGGSLNTDAIFRRALDAELEKICSFYQSKEAEIFTEVEDVLRDAEEYAHRADTMNVDPMSDAMVKGRTASSSSRQRPGSIVRPVPSNQERRHSAFSETLADDDDDDADSDDEPAHQYRPQSHGAESSNPDGSRTDDMRDSVLWGADSRILGYSGPSTHRGGAHDEHFSDPIVVDLYNSGLSLKKRAVATYVSICGLKSYIQLNKTGFSKALKKYDKILDRNLRREYMNSVVSLTYPFKDSTMEKVDDNIRKVEEVYANVVTTGNIPLAKRELRLHLREHVVWERNTVWREMIGIERKAQAANVGIRRTLLGGDEDPSKARRQGDEQEVVSKMLRTPFGVIRIPQWLCSLSLVTLVLILLVFGILLSVPIMEKPEQQNCLAMLVFVSLLWATEVIPLFVTSLLIPFLVVMLRIMLSDNKPHERLGAKEATAAAFSAMWTPVIMLLLGGFTIAAALSKYDIARRMAMFVLSKAGSNPNILLLTNMFVSMFLSMWISNVASPVLCYSIIQPLLRNLAPDSSFAKSLVLGIALAANVGGAASPIASPQNIIALQNIYPSMSWGTWFFISLPVCILSIVAIWMLLVLTFKPGRETAVAIRPLKDKFTGVQWFISLVTLSTIALWCGSHQLEHIFGDMGVIAIIPMVLFFGTGILNKEDFNNFLWTIIILAAGGLCLGKAVTSSGLLHTLANAIRLRVEHLSLYGVLLVFSALILVIATFISHTVAALIMLPLVRQIGLGMDDPHPNLLVMASALMCSVAMALPTSGFPNMTAIMTEVPQTGQRYLQVRHFFTRGIPASLMSFAVIVTVGYGLMYIAGL
ncbi:plasma membrane phosphate transporter Pho87 [Aspergillus eucalypticola CBS 122712]|uniref:Small ribosomal subunit protein uS7m n=1 Tax=Aspergillus eucalypticola (strain CBS 122712 / IBT 29274) TaxID=1448314 RepID=A0A317WJC3_ASPEC|nr:plasma membrane phosphate transporter Pho87 [Aspergillus eucalypticola CBS 122712]PWY85382.1 plasma membrane phosphate transporter Pho87 [Aspergillus eucalypticola CBS 122712]